MWTALVVPFWGHPDVRHNENRQYATDEIRVGDSAYRNVARRPIPLRRHFNQEQAANRLCRPARGNDKTFLPLIHPLLSSCVRNDHLWSLPERDARSVIVPRCWILLTFCILHGSISSGV